MISIIVSSHNASFFQRFTKSVEQTIGVPYEIVQIHNQNEMGICEAYNIGASKSNNEYLCFVHEDVEFKTLDWGCQLIEKCNSDSTIGLIGVAGSIYKSLAPGRGWYNDDMELDRLYLIQHTREPGKVIFENRVRADYEDVVSLDGVFLFTKKQVWQQHKFDSETFKNFHCYDLDFSLRVSQSFRVQVTNQLLIEHFSPGNLDRIWLHEFLKFSNKWKHQLPLGRVPHRPAKDIEWSQKRWFFEQLTKYNFPKRTIFRSIIGFGFFKFFSLTQSWQMLGLLLRMGTTKSNA